MSKIQNTLAALCVSIACGQDSFAHENHDKKPSSTVSTEDAVVQFDNSFLDGEQKYRWLHRPDLGSQPKEMLAAARLTLHNDADVDLVTGEIVTIVHGYGLVTLSPDLKQWTLVAGQDDSFANELDGHGVECFTEGGQSFWAFASNRSQEVIITNRGQIIDRLKAPTGSEFSNPTVNEYFTEGGNLGPCDLVYFPKDKSIIVVTGYSDGDYVLTAKMIEGHWRWSGAAWGGKAWLGGPFVTAHGIERVEDRGLETLRIASRFTGRIFGYTSDGAQIDLPGPAKQYHLQLPEQSRACNVACDGKLEFISLLMGIPGSNGIAPVLALREGKIVGDLRPGSYAGLQLMRHIHSFRPIRRGKERFALALSWPNPDAIAKGQPSEGRMEVFQAVREQ